MIGKIDIVAFVGGTVVKSLPALAWRMYVSAYVPGPGDVERLDAKMRKCFRV